MSYRRTAFMATVAMLLFASLASAAIGPSNSDLWDVSQGTIVTAGSPALNWNSFNRSDLSNMFGAVLSGTCCGDQAIFGDEPQGYVDFVEWETPAPITLRSFVLSANHDAPPRDATYRGFSRFSLYAKSPSTGMFNKLFEVFPSNPYGNTPTPINSLLETDQDKTLLTLWANVTPTTAKEFRAEFVQSGSHPEALGPRIFELDGYDTTAAIGHIAALHQGSNDPVTEGWTKYRPFSSVDTFPVTNDSGLGIDAWSVDDNAGFGPPGHDGVYGQVLTPSQVSMAETYGWRYSVDMRIADSEVGITHDSIMASVIDSTHTYTMQFGRTAEGKPLVMLTTGEDVGPTVEVDDLSNGYHLYEMGFNPSSHDVTLFIDGVSRITGYGGRLGADLGTGTGATGNINFGSTSNNYTGQANYNLVQFTIVPEPSSCVIAGLGAVALFATRKKRS